MLNEIESINTYINTLITYRRDGTKDHWQTLDESLARKLGDCEDYACAKFHLLHKSGYDPHLMACYINGESHMVCVCDGLVLDNYNTSLRTLRERTDLSEPVYTAHLSHCECRGKVIPVASASKWLDWLKRSGLYED
jgi:predicted transglutaminase-like cysteine proteinase